MDTFNYLGPDSHEFLLAEIEAEEQHEDEIRAAVRDLEQQTPTLAFLALPFGACPMQAVGEYEGDEFYFRFRYDRARLDFRGKSVTKGQVTGEPLAGVLNGSEFKSLFERMLKAATDA
jgi:hypothetical protein